MKLSDQLNYIWTIRARLFEGLGISLLIAFVAIVIGLVIGIVLAMIKIAPKNGIVMKILDKVADTYITVIRGTPMLVQLLIMYGVILVSFKASNTNLLVPIISFGINSGAYMAEIIRSGINSIDQGQMEAGRSLGLSWVTTMLKVIIPQAIKVVIPTIFNEIIILVKETSVVAYILLRVNGKQVWDLLGIAEKLGLAKPACYMSLIFTVAIIYLAVVLLLTLVQKLIERRLKKNER
ncbi:MAG: amino acid ABC transporter permease [Clostridia bacterium]|jgi:polar amino acid transport system permease protein|nr:amino acid ABC transporter permease [Clostridia bacterium]